MKRLMTLVMVVVLALSIVTPSVALAKTVNNNCNDDDHEKYALLIGISDYPGTTSILEGGLDLFYADKDARTIKQILIDDYGFESKNIKTLLNSSATDLAILSAIKEWEMYIS